MTVDIAILGGGLIGCAIAHRLAKTSRLRVLVLERAVPGAEASSAAAGILGAQSEFETPSPLFDFAVESRRLWGAYAEELEEDSGLPVGHAEAGLFRFCFDSGASPLATETLAAAEAKFAWQRERGLRIEVLDRETLDERVPYASNLATGALYFPDEGQVDPRLVVKSLKLAAVRAGVRFQTGFARRIRVEKGAVTGIALDDESIICPEVVLAAGSWSGLVPIDGVTLPAGWIRPVRGQVVELEAERPLFRATMSSHAGYLVPRPDGRVVCGSTVEEAGFEKRVTAEGLGRLLGLATTLVPALGRATVLSSWSNFRPTTPHGLPLLGALTGSLGENVNGSNGNGSAKNGNGARGNGGEDHGQHADRGHGSGEGPKGLWLATGHFRNGVLLTPATAHFMADLILAGEGEAPTFHPSRHQEWAKAFSPSEAFAVIPTIHNGQLPLLKGTLQATNRKGETQR